MRDLYPRKSEWRQYREGFLREMRNRNTKETYGIALTQFRSFIRRQFKELDLIRGEYSEIREAIKTWVWEGTAKWTEITMSCKTQVIQSFYSWLIVEDVRKDNPAQRIRITKLDCQRDLEFPCSELADRFVDALRTEAKERGLTGKRDVLLVRILRESGIRASELGDLRVSDIDVETGQLLVRNGKRNKTRRTAILPATAQLAQEYCAEAGVSGEDWLFLSAKRLTYGKGKSEHLNRKSIFWILHKRATVLGFSDEEVKLLSSPHNFRHLWATEHAEAGTPPLVIQSMGGWTDSAMVMYYVDKVNITAVAVDRTTKRGE